MQFELEQLQAQHEQLSEQHRIDHLTKDYRLIVDHSCVVCFSRPRVVTLSFQNFWNWIKTYHAGTKFTVYSVQALHVYFAAFKNDPNNKKCRQVVNIAVQLLLSITYTIRPTLYNLLYAFLNLTYRTDYFANPVTPEVIQAFRDRLELENNKNNNQAAQPQNQPLPLVPQPPPLPPPQQVPMADQAQITAALQAVFGANAANLLGRGTPIAKIENFSGKDEEDPIEWLEIFTRAATTNNWATEQRKCEIAASFLRGAAADWYQANSAAMNNNWATTTNNGNNFTDLFKGYFANDTRKNFWYQELLTLRQTSNENVDSYANKFSKLLKKVDPTNGIPDAQKKRMFLFGLNPALTPMVNMQNTAAGNLNALIGHARNAETGYNYACMGPTITTRANPVNTNVRITATTTPIVPTPDATIAKLTKQMEQLSINYANLYSAINNDNRQGNRRSNVSFGNNSNRNSFGNNNNRNNRNNQGGGRPINPNIRCYNCGQTGHISRNCQGRRNDRQNTTNVNYMDYGEEYYGTDEEYED